MDKCWTCIIQVSRTISVTYTKRGDLRLSGSIIRKSRFIFTKERESIRQKCGCLNYSNERIFQVYLQIQGGGLRIPGNGVHMYEGVGVALLIVSHLSSISHELAIIWSH